jgi:amidase
MKRRAFVTHGSVAVAGIATVSGVACSKETINKQGTEANSASNDDFELNEITINELQEQMASGKYTSEAITSLYLNRIAALDKNGPKLNAIIELNPDALAIAKTLDEERKAGKVRGRLHGIPVLIKENIDTADKMMTTAGSLALANHVASRDSFLVKKLRDAGAVILGKTNLSEWANFRSTKSCSGWSSRGGQTKMPYYIDHNPCGSSSGSGVAVSANLCVVAIGTETDGSVTCPASTNGTVGLKPTVGLVSRTGIIPISFTQDTAGPLTRTVTDTAILLNAMAGIDADDEKTKGSEGKIANDYTSFLDLNGLKGKRIGVDKKKYENQFLNRLQESALAAMKQQGAEIIELDYLQSLQDLGDEEFELLKFEFKDGLNKYLSTANASVKTLQEVIEFNRQHEDEAMPTFKQEILEDSEKKAGLDSKEYLELLKKVHVGSQKIIDTLLLEHKLDALGGLTMGPSCAIDTIYGDRWGDVFLTAPAAMAGYPHICVPAGFVYDLPVGFSFYGAAWSEGQLIGMAFAFEQATKHRRKPEFKAAFAL